jgi:hypothetical protein
VRCQLNRRECVDPPTPQALEERMLWALLRASDVQSPASRLGRTDERMHEGAPVHVQLHPQPGAVDGVPHDVLVEEETLHALRRDSPVSRLLGQIQIHEPKEQLRHLQKKRPRCRRSL